MITEIEFNKGLNKIRRESMQKYCFYGFDCINFKISRAHSIQENTILKNISLNSHVLSVKHKLLGDELTFSFDEIGKGEASIFSGFCNHHDTNIFKPIETREYQPYNCEQDFLFAYRALAVGHFSKKAHQNTLSIIRDSLNGDNDLIYNYFPQFNNFSPKYHAKINIAYEAVSNACINLERLRKSFNINLKNQNYHHLKTKLIVFDTEYHFVTSSYIYLPYDVYGKKIQNIDSNRYIAPLFLTIFPKNGKTYVLMSHLKKDSGLFEFIDKQIFDVDTINQQKIISNIVARYISNFYLSPIRWNSLNEDTRRKTIEELNYCLSGQGRSFIDTDFNLFM